jgi:quercetin dioxygenase-like cupin family protein
MKNLVIGMILGVAAATLVQWWPSASAKGPAPRVITATATAATRTAPNGAATVRLLVDRSAGATSAFLAVLDMKAGAAVPEHADATEELIYVMEGSGEIIVDGQTHAVQVGDAIFMPAGAKVRFQNGDAPFKALQVFAPMGPEAKYDKWTP